MKSSSSGGSSWPIRRAPSREIMVLVEPSGDFWLSNASPSVRLRISSLMRFPSGARRQPLGGSQPTLYARTTLPSGLRVVALRLETGTLDVLSYACSAELNPLVEPIPVPWTDAVPHLFSMVRY